MAYDFSAKQLKVSRIIGSGSVGFNGGIMIYSASISTNNEGGVPAALTADVGDDVFLFVSGSKDYKGKKRLLDLAQRQAVV